jgi:hypothetical protein
LQRIQKGEVLIISNRRRGGLILRKPFYAEFIGPGAIIGGNLDLNCQRIIPLGKLSLISPSDPEELHRSYLIRRQWVLNTRRFTELSEPSDRAQQLIDQLENYFGGDIIRHISPDDLAAIAGIFPTTIEQILNR